MKHSVSNLIILLISLIFITSCSDDDGVSPSSRLKEISHYVSQYNVSEILYNDNGKAKSLIFTSGDEDYDPLSSVKYNFYYTGDKCDSITPEDPESTKIIFNHEENTIIPERGGRSNFTFYFNEENYIDSLIDQNGTVNNSSIIEITRDSDNNLVRYTETSNTKFEYRDYEGGVHNYDIPYFPPAGGYEIFLHLAGYRFYDKYPKRFFFYSDFSDSGEYFNVDFLNVGKKQLELIYTTDEGTVRYDNDVYTFY